MNWVENIPRKMAKSRALLGGKSAIMQRLFNILWNQQGKIIPFYFELQDYNQWLLAFADLRSDWGGKDLSTVEAVIKTLDYEIKNRKHFDVI